MPVKVPVPWVGVDAVVGSNVVQTLSPPMQAARASGALKATAPIATPKRAPFSVSKPKNAI